MYPLLLRLIINMYISQNIRVKCNDCISHEYDISNGVKQCSVISLFNLYVKKNIECLDREGLGCHMGNQFSGCFIYADDITLVSPSADALNAMLKVCELYVGEHDITFNSNKTKLMQLIVNLLDLSKITSHYGHFLIAIKKIQPLECPSWVLVINYKYKKGQPLETHYMNVNH